VLRIREIEPLKERQTTDGQDNGCYDRRPRQALSRRSEQNTDIAAGELAQAHSFIRGGTPRGQSQFTAMAEKLETLFLGLFCVARTA
jgi:hypothetical protein